MKKLIIKLHSIIDVITNSSTEIFTLDTEMGSDIIKGLLRKRCEETDEMEWYENELTVTQLENSKVEIHSFLNEPDWLYDFLKPFNYIES